MTALAHEGARACQHIASLPEHLDGLAKRQAEPNADHERKFAGAGDVLARAELDVDDFVLVDCQTADAGDKHFRHRDGFDHRPAHAQVFHWPAPRKASNVHAGAKFRKGIVTAGAGIPSRQRLEVTSDFLSKARVAPRALEHGRGAS